MEISQSVLTTPNFNILAEDQIEQIYYAALDVVENTGARFLHQEARDIFGGSEALVTRDNVVRVPAYLVEKALRNHPSKITFQGWNREKWVNLQKDEVAFGADVGPTISAGSRGNSSEYTFEQIHQTAKLVDALPNLDFLVSSTRVNNRTPLHITDQQRFLTLLQGCSKPLLFSDFGRHSFKDLWRMAVRVRGTEKECRLHPMFAVYIESFSTLSFDWAFSEKLLFCAEKGIPFVYHPVLMAGVNAPVSLAGMLVLVLAQTMLISVLSYLKKPGTPLIMGGELTVSCQDGKIPSLGSPEHILAAGAKADLAKWIDIPVLNTGGCSDANVLDGQSAAELCTSLFYQFLSGTNLIQGLGRRNVRPNLPLESITMCDEIIGMIMKFGGGISTRDEYMALELIDRVGPGGEFLTQEHTLEHWREWFRPRFIDRMPYQVWEKKGRVSMHDKLKIETEKIIAGHQPAPLEGSLLFDLQAIINEAERG
ncbi:MAG: trimethylamine methyltransferase family protein [Desulfohalobiaceae bacterium]|nr:trimethylamine methyltransferase family protein [Desulfohalobiaceae bacterium]